MEYYGLFSVDTGAYQGGLGYFESLEEAMEDAALTPDEQELSYVGVANWASF